MSEVKQTTIKVRGEYFDLSQRHHHSLPSSFPQFIIKVLLNYFLIFLLFIFIDTRVIILEIIIINQIKQLSAYLSVKVLSFFFFFNYDNYVVKKQQKKKMSLKI